MVATTKKKTSKRGSAKSNGRAKAIGQSIILGDGPYQLIPIDRITIIERPPEGQEADQLLFNPRSLDSFDPESMSELRESIKNRGLLHPVTVRVRTEDEEIVSIELIAGERRFRSIKMLVDNDEKVFDKDSREMVPASELYSHIPCCPRYDISDEEAFGLMCEENGKTKPLTVREEILLVERLLGSGYNQDTIANMIGENGSWVSHTSNFQKYLPKDAFEKLVQGQMTRHVAVNLISYPEEKRDEVFQSAKKAEEEARNQRLNDLQTELEEAEDAQILHEDDKAKAEEAGDQVKVDKAAKASKAAQARASKAAKKKEKVEKDAGKINQGDLAAGARNAGIAPKKAKQLSKSDINQLIVEPLDGWINDGEYEAESGEVVEEDILNIIRTTVVCIAEGERNPEIIMERAMKASGRWMSEEDEEGGFEDEEDDDAYAAAAADFENEGGDDYYDEEEEDF